MGQYDYKFRTLSKEAFIADLERIGLAPNSGTEVPELTSKEVEEKVKLDKEINDYKKDKKPKGEKGKEPKTDDLFEKVKTKVSKEALDKIERVSDKIKYNEYAQNFDVCIKWNGTLVTGQEFDEEGNITNPGVESTEVFVDLRTEQPLPEGFESLMQDTVIDNNFPHEFS